MPPVEPNQRRCHRQDGCVARQAIAGPLSVSVQGGTHDAHIMPRDEIWVQLYLFIEDDDPPRDEASHMTTHGLLIESQKDLDGIFYRINRPIAGPDSEKVVPPPDTGVIVGHGNGLEPATSQCLNESGPTRFDPLSRLAPNPEADIYTRPSLHSFPDRKSV